jgi:hypothetical protein
MFVCAFWFVCLCVYVCISLRQFRIKCEVVQAAWQLPMLGPLSLDFMPDIDITRMRMIDITRLHIRTHTYTSLHPSCRIYANPKTVVTHGVTLVI